MIKNRYNLGNFIINSEIVISDPKFKIGHKYQNIFNNNKIGKWKSYVYQTKVPVWGELCSELVAIHENHIFSDLNWLKSEQFIFVDSGIIGIFDKNFYNNNFSEIKPNYNTLISHDKKSFKLNYGVLSYSGFGNGLYEVYSAYNNKEIIAIKIVFIKSQDEEDYDFEEEI